MSELTEADCWTRLRSLPVGRIGYLEQGVPVIRPINFSVLDRTIVIWTVPGGSGTTVAGQTVAFEVDQVDTQSRSGWTVLTTGIAEAVTDVDELVAATDVPHRPWVAEHDDQVIRIRVNRVSGLQLPAFPPPS
ncbi:pyridoxamine 5'-phosphate oxidase family protein [Nocardia grenadensis]|uniref:pyridoxamine 5'-phosphate oxidase family protein n=1 Tax=Nocardia grenadensis TaxID=931537 RepID=UPI003D73CBE9